MSKYWMYSRCGTGNQARTGPFAARETAERALIAALQGGHRTPIWIVEVEDEEEDDDEDSDA